MKRCPPLQQTYSSLTAKNANTTTLLQQLNHGSDTPHKSWLFQHLEACGVPTCVKTIDLNILGDNGTLLKKTLLELLKDLDLSGWKDILNPDDLELCRISGAMTNMVYHLLGPESSSSDTRLQLLFRVYGIGSDQFVQRDKELLSNCRLSRIGLSPQLKGVFFNGRFEQFVDSTTLTKDDIKDPETSQQIARYLAKIHHMYDSLDATEQKVELFDKLWDWYDMALDNASKCMAAGVDLSAKLGFDLEILKKEILGLQKIPSVVNSPAVFAHNDTQYGNILRLNTAHKELMIVDYEYASAGYRGYDIANHFCEWAADYHCDTPHLMDFRKYPNPEERNRFFRAYLEEYNKADPTFEVTKEMLDELQRECQVYAVVSCMSWALWGVMQTPLPEAEEENLIEFDFLGYAKTRFESYFDMKKEMKHYLV